MIQPIRLSEKFATFSEHWSPKIIARMNDSEFKLVKFQGEFVWHYHERTDEVFLVVEGEMTVHFRDGDVTVGRGEMIAIPKGVEHKPSAASECWMMIIETAGTVNTGSAGGAMTAPLDVWIGDEAPRPAEARPAQNAAAVDVAAHNRTAWDQQVAAGNRWTVPVGAEVIAAAREGRWSIVLTPTKPVPREWFGELAGRDVLALASGGGQQSPVLAAAGARVTVLDNSPGQLQQDRLVAERDGLTLRLELGDMRDLGRFDDQSFDLIFHPVSNGFIPDVRPVWRECFRVLRPGGCLLAGFTNPAVYLFDEPEDPRGLIVRHAVPYSDLESLSRDTLDRRIASGEPLEFGHSLTDQIGGQIDAGFVLASLYEDGWPEHSLGKFMQPFLATRAVRPLHEV